MTGRPIARPSSTAMGWFSYQVLGTSATDEARSRSNSWSLGSRPWKVDPARGLGGGQRLQLGPRRPVTGDVQVGRLRQVGDGPDGDVDPLLRRDAARR